MPTQIASESDGAIAIAGDRIELVVVDQLEDRGVEVEAVPAGIALHLTLDFDQVGGQRVHLRNRGHRVALAARPS